jgi:serine protease Do
VGITSEDMTPTLARRLGYPLGYGALIDEVRSGTPADRAGLRGGDHEVDFNGKASSAGGDLVVAIAGRPVRTADDLVRTVTEHVLPGQQVVFTVIRDRKRLRVPVTLVQRPTDPQSGR